MDEPNRTPLIWEVKQQDEGEGEGMSKPTHTEAQMIEALKQFDNGSEPGC